jgi:hypothetical protein
LKICAKLSSPQAKEAKEVIEAKEQSFSKYLLHLLNTKIKGTFLSNCT